jgi:hypothetical protein
MCCCPELCPSFYETYENAVKTQIWIAVSVYVLAAIVPKRLGIEASITRWCRSFRWQYSKNLISKAFLPKAHGSDTVTENKRSN